MKFISKLSPPTEFTNWLALKNDDWEPTYKDMPADIKVPLQAALMHEQGYICCYCEQRITPNSSHIEHLKPQEKASESALDYANLLCSCQRRMTTGEPLHCAKAKDNWYDPILLISPLDATCEQKFTYTSDGRIKPADQTDNAAIVTISKLKLDLDKLNRLRKAAIAALVNDSERVIRQALSITKSGECCEFHTTVASYYNISL